PSYSAQVESPVMGWIRRLTRVFQLPMWKSKSRWPAGVAGADASRTRVWSVIQFASQVFPPSSENDCSKWAESGVISDQIYRTRMVLPLKGSWSKNSPRPFLNSPMVG